MKCLSIRPPWADLIVLGFKKVEFRSWKADYRGPVAIHAGQSVDKAAIPYIAKMLDQCWKLNRYVGDEHRELMRRYLAYPRRGVVLAVANLVSIDKSEYHDKELGFSPEEWGWVLEDVKPLKREVPMKGQLGLFSIQADLLDQIQRAVIGTSKDIQVDLKVQELNRKPLQEPPGPSRKPSGDGRYVQKGLFKVPV